MAASCASATRLKRGRRATLAPVTAAPERTRALPAYRLRFQERPGYLYAHVQGEEDSFDITRDYWLAIAGECARRGTRSLLVLDELTADPATREELERLVPSLVGLGFEGMRIAFVEPHSARVALVEHAELLARELGYTVRVFGEFSAADLWLRHGEV